MTMVPTSNTNLSWAAVLHAGHRRARGTRPRASVTPWSATSAQDTRSAVVIAAAASFASGTGRSTSSSICAT